MDGEWQNNLPHGQITEMFADGKTSYVGQYEQGLRQG